MPAEVPYFKVALNLPHAGRIARRIVALLDHKNDEATPAVLTAGKLLALLEPYYDSEENPPKMLVGRVREQAARLGRQLVDEIERDKMGHDRLGQCVRNFFECLELGREGTLISLRAGENPDSLQRPF